MSEKTLNEIGLKYGTDKASSGHNYLENYEYFLGKYKEKPITLIEIGGLNGASLKMWEEYFSKGKIVCLDVNPKVADFASDRIAVEIGNAGDRSILMSLIDKHGIPEIIIDDGSHRWDHQRIAFKTLFKHLADCGFYIIEDLHTSFEPNFAGQEDIPFIEILFILSRYLQLRGQRARDFEQIFNPELANIAKSIDSITFISRSCIIKKK